MANIKITDLPALTNPATTDVLPIVDINEDVTKKVSVGEIVGKISGDVNVSTNGISSIASGAIVNADINASAAIADTKLATISTAGKVSNSATTATDANTASAIVARDASGDFSAGTITADISGNSDTATALETARDIGGVSFDGTANINLPGVNTTGNQDTSGNAATATKLDSSRTFAVTGDVTGTVSSDLTSGASIATSIASGVIVNADINASAAIAGTKIDPDFGSQTVETTGVFSAAGGAAATPSIAFTGDLNTGIYSPGADQVAISTNGTQRLLIEADGDINIDSGGVFYDATNNRLAIGTTSPANKLHVEGDISVGTVGGSGPYSLFWAPTTGGQVVKWFRNDGGSFAIGRGTTSGTNEEFRIDSSGRLLVGTSSSLDVGGITPLIQSADAGNSAGFGAFRYSNDVPGPLIHLFKSRGGTVGTNAIVQQNDALGEIRFTGADGTNEILGAQIRCDVDGTPGANDMPGRLVFSTTADGANSPTERMRIASNGRASIYATLDNTFVATNSAGAGTTFAFMYGQHSATGTNTGTISYAVFTNGDVQNTNNSYGAYSDIKLKENIVDAKSQWDDLKGLRVVNYNFKPETGAETYKQLGLIAQEVELVSPGLVSESPDRDEEGNDLGTVTKSVNYSVLYMKAVKALQEAMERIETLEASNADLLARVSVLEQG